MKNSLKQLKKIGEEVQLLSHSTAVLDWDQQTCLPGKGIETRARQLALLEGMIHERVTSEKVGKLLFDLGASQDNPMGDDSLSEIDRSFVRHFYRMYSKSNKLSKDLVEKLSRETSRGQAVWATAKGKNDYSIFKDQLRTIMDIVKEKAGMIGYEEHPYDALLDEFEPWAKTMEVEAVFNKVKANLVPFLEKIKNAPQVDDSFLHQKYNPQKQKAFGEMVLNDLGYDFDRGRLDVSTHPFTTTLGPDDIRITTRYNENFFNTSIFGTIHECGHALYEMGFGGDVRGNILGGGTSLGIHESQSRTWENLVGRSLPFWKHYFPKLQKMFPENLDPVTLDEFYKAVNKVSPSFIRVEADEATYSLHIILRFTIETKLLAGEISVDELPQVWNENFENLFGIRPENDSVGVLQDVHWSAGLIGYFPTYALGNLYGAQFYNQLEQKNPDIGIRVEEGQFNIILNWLRENIHVHGSIYSADELCSRVTGEELNPDYFLQYLKDKYSRIYDL